MKDESGPAFPTIEEQYIGMDQRWAIVTIPGMTKRELIAMHNLQGLISKYELKNPGDQQIISKMATQLADALLAELARE